MEGITLSAKVGGGRGVSGARRNPRFRAGLLGQVSTRSGLRARQETPNEHGSAESRRRGRGRRRRGCVTCRPAAARTSCRWRPSPAWPAAAAAGREAQVLEGGTRFPLLQPQPGGESRYVSGKGSEFTGEDTASPCYQNVGSIR